jgi:hypothetical protein
MFVALSSEIDSSSLETGVHGVFASPATIRA